MRNDVKTIVTDAAAIGVTAADLTMVQVPVLNDGAVYHCGQAYCSEFRKDEGINWVKEKVSFTTLVADVCSECAYGIVASSNADPVIRIILLLLEAADIFAAAEDLFQKYKLGLHSPGTLKRSDNGLGRMEEDLGDMICIVPGHLQELYSKTMAKIAEMRSALQKMTKGTVQHNKIEELAWEVLIPAAWSFAQLDYTPVLMGFAGKAYTNMQEILEAYSIRAEENIWVLSCPRYVYEYVSRVYVPANGAPQIFLTCADFKGSDEMAEVVAALWDPSGASLSSMPNAILAAEAALAK